MNKLLKFIAAGLGIGLVIAMLAWNYINKKVADISDVKPTLECSSSDILERTAADTAGVNKLIDACVAIKGPVKKINLDEASCTIELGDSNSTSSVVCQIDRRYREQFTQVRTGEEVAIKGTFTGYTVDLDLGLGNTVEMKNCTFHKSISN